MRRSNSSLHQHMMMKRRLDSKQGNEQWILTCSSFLCLDTGLLIDGTVGKEKAISYLKIGAMEEQLGQFMAAIAAFKDEIKGGQNSVKEEMKAVQASVKDEMKSVQESVKDEMKAVQEEMKLGQESVKEEVKAVKEEITCIIENKFQAIEVRIDAVEDKVGEIQGRVSAVEQRIEGRLSAAQ
ncbi:hypothetical protein X975_21037, partial [Stegodyphus mimosarum]